MKKSLWLLLLPLVVSPVVAIANCSSQTKSEELVVTDPTLEVAKKELENYALEKIALTGNFSNNEVIEISQISLDNLVKDVNFKWVNSVSVSLKDKEQIIKTSATPDVTMVEVNILLTGNLKSNSTKEIIVERTVAVHYNFDNEVVSGHELFQRIKDIADPIAYTKMTTLEDHLNTTYNVSDAKAKGIDVEYELNEALIIKAMKKDDNSKLDFKVNISYALTNKILFTKTCTMTIQGEGKYIKETLASITDIDNTTSYQSFSEIEATIKSQFQVLKSDWSLKAAIDIDDTFKPGVENSTMKASIQLLFKSTVMNTKNISIKVGNVKDYADAVKIFEEIKDITKVVVEDKAMLEALILAKTENLPEGFEILVQTNFVNGTKEEEVVAKLLLTYKEKTLLSKEIKIQITTETAIVKDFQKIVSSIEEKAVRNTLQDSFADKASLIKYFQEWIAEQMLAKGYDLALSKYTIKVEFSDSVWEEVIKLSDKKDILIEGEASLQNEKGEKVSSSETTIKHVVLGLSLVEQPQE